MAVSEATYERVALEDPEGLWELVCGRLRGKPGMTVEHEDIARILVRILNSQLDPAGFSVGMNSPRLRVSTQSYFVPDVCVVPRAVIRRRREGRPRELEVYDESMPLVVEVWSPSTGEYDVEEKLREYQRRGDLEVWRVHPYDRTLTSWRRVLDGSYAMSSYRSGSVEPAALPGVTIALDELFNV